MFQYKTDVLHVRMSGKEWDELMDRREVEDISHELSDSFLMFGQVMRAKIRWDGKIWFASAWKFPPADVFVDLIETPVGGYKVGTRKVEEASNETS